MFSHVYSCSECLRKIIVNFPQVNIFAIACMNSEAFTSEQYWSGRYQEGDIPWDTGGPTLPLQTYLDSLEDRDLRILIPGAGSGWEAEYARSIGFKQVFVLDISADALKRLGNRCPKFPRNQLLHEDFFSHRGTYDLILEQTFSSLQLVWSRED
jgi:thiopurine S-methyltransferase